MSIMQTTPWSIRPWLLEHVCPYWSKRVIDPQGGFFEALDDVGRVIESSRKTVLYQARLTYVFSHATFMGGGNTMRMAADHGFDFLRRDSVLTGRFEGWHRATTRQGEIVDPIRDAYDQAFVIFAMAWYHRASGSQEAVHLAEHAYGFFESHLADSSTRHGGFFEEYPDSNKLPRRQNPHMHLLEAVLAMYAATGHEVWLARAKLIIDLFISVFFDEKTGSLAEFFDATWQLADGSPGLLREPGHQFEWVWLLQQYVQQAGPAAGVELEHYASRLFDFGSRYGIDTVGPLQGLVFEAITAQGLELATSKLLWPQTEYIKACVARYEATKDPAFRRKAVSHMALMRTHFFRSDGANWINHVARDGAPLVTQTPARVLYHLFLAASELIRIEEA